MKNNEVKMDDKTKESLQDIFRILKGIQNEIDIIEKRVQMLENVEKINNRLNHRDGVMRF
jgi:hypothetical protein